MADGSIIIDTRIDTGGVSKGMNAVKAGVTRISAQVSKMGDSAKSSFQRQITAITDLYQNYEKQERKVSELKSKLEELSKVKIETEEYKKLKDDMKALEDEFEKIEAKQREWLDMGFSIDSAPLKELDKQMDGIWADIDRLQRKQKEMQATGRAYVDPSIKINRSKYNNHIRPVLGKIKVQKIEKRAVVKLQQDLSKKLSASMTNGVIVLLKTVLNAAVDDEILMKNPAASVKPLRKDDRPKASETIHRALTREEQQAFMQEAKTEWLYEFFCFSLCTGMRLNEITALKWQDIDYINNVIRVNKTVSWKEGGGIEETLPKSDTSNRDIPMNDTIKKILQMQKTKMSMVYGEIHARKMDSNIFIGSNGAKAIASSTVSSAIDNVLKRLRQQGIEIERFTHHAFRDTFATRYVEEGGNMQTLQKILGHSSLAMTADLYAHVLPNTKQQEMQQIENGFIGVAVL